MLFSFVIFGFLIHLIFFYSIFDIYFTSPLSHGLHQYSNHGEAPAKRIVLFVADGLRYDKLYEIDSNGISNAPFIRSQIKHEGIWGFSHTHVPTESRPGHVAMIAGFYEDISAVAKGWKENPVDFDSVFNQSRYTWSWGSPDILPIFSKGAIDNHIFTYTYPGENEDFAGNDLSKLDTWVFENVKDFFKNLTFETKDKLHKDKLIFFLHLLGMDTTGHVHKPQSGKYSINMKIMDKGIAEITQLFTNFYKNDGKTAFIFTSDHGMTNWGSHGAGHPTETITPLVAWGAGIKKPQESLNNIFYSSEDWGLNMLQNYKIEQADLCPLMASLIGSNIPTNSIGLLPVNILNSSEQFMATSLLVNAKQIYEQYKYKKEEKRSTTLSFLFIPFETIDGEMELSIQQLNDQIQARNFSTSIMKEINLFFYRCLSGIDYYHKYNRFILGLNIALGYIGWMIFISIILIEDYTDISAKYSKINIKQNWYYIWFLKILFAGLFLIVFSLLMSQSQPWTYYLYMLTPLYLWYKVFSRVELLRKTYWYIQDFRMFKTIFIHLIFGILALEIIIVAFTYRQLLSIGLLCLAIWGRFEQRINLSSNNLAISDRVVNLWVLFCCFTAIFPLLPTIGHTNDSNIVLISGIIFIVILLLIKFILFFNQNDGFSKAYNQFFTCIQLVITLICLYIIYLVRYGGLKPVSSSNNWIYPTSWAILICAPCLPMIFSSRGVIIRLTDIFVQMFAPFILCSLLHEGFFYLSLVGLMGAWLFMEIGVSMNMLMDIEFGDNVSLITSKIKPRKLKLSDLRSSYFFLFFILTSFFGTGNIASINSFDPSSVLCFVTVFNPFVMGGLLLIKILIPFIVVACTFEGIRTVTRVPTKAFCLIVLLMSDYMALQFFFLVRDEGSWLDIGTSISHYIIVMTTIIFLFLLLTLAKILTVGKINLPFVRRIFTQKYHRY